MRVVTQRIVVARAGDADSLEECLRGRGFLPITGEEPLQRGRFRRRAISGKHVLEVLSWDFDSRPDRFDADSGREAGLRGGPARMRQLSAAERSEFARRGALARWAAQRAAAR